MTVTLITPPSVFLLDERVFVNLGILKIASQLESQGIPVDHLDLSGLENYIQALQSYLRNSYSSHIGITTTTPQLPAVVKIVRAIRILKPDVKIILGGPHITLTHSAVKLEKKKNRVSRAHHSLAQLHQLADILVSGDGEFAIFLALREDAPSLIDADDMYGELFLTSEKYEKTPLPARHLVDMKSYKYNIENHPSTSLIAQLGCPFNCGFCGGRNSKSLRIIRTRSSESVVKEIRHLYEQYGYTGFMFYDDELNVNKKIIELMNQISELQDELGVDFHFRGFVKSQLFTDEQAQSMYRAGFRWILSGFESGSERMLENMNKKATRLDNTRAMEIAKKNNIKVKALMSLGHPGESEKTIQETQDWLLEVKPDDFDCTIITTYPGTPYYDEAIPHPLLKGVWSYTSPKTGDQLHSYEIDYMEVADYYKGDPQGGYKSFVFTDYISPQFLVQKRNEVEEVVRRILNIPYPQARPALRFEHSMGQQQNLWMKQSLPHLIELEDKDYLVSL